MNFESWLLFSTIALIATITPGPAIILVSANSSSYGVKKAIYTILGNISGLFCMSLMAVLGLSTLILCSAPIFFTLKIIGTLYLIYLGVKMWKNGITGTHRSASHARFLQPLRVILSFICRVCSYHSAILRQLLLPLLFFHNLSNLSCPWHLNSPFLCQHLCSSHLPACSDILFWPEKQKRSWKTGITTHKQLPERSLEQSL